jgi:hypothetical protein
MVPIEPELYEELLSDAHAALFQGHLRRAILELALSCEIATKRAFFGKESVAASAYEYLEDKGQVRASVPDLLGQVAKHAFGKSFKDTNSNAYKQIDYLFRCRNKIAHRGECKYNDDEGHTHTVDQATANVWLKAAHHLLEWLRGVEP